MKVIILSIVYNNIILFIILNILSIQEIGY